MKKKVSIDNSFNKNSNSLLIKISDNSNKLHSDVRTKTRTNIKILSMTALRNARAV